MDYYVLLERLIRAMTELKELDLDGINAALEGLCKLFRVCKGVTQFFPSLRHEKLGRGETFVCYDSGEEGQVVLTQRVVTDAMTVASCSVYMTPDAAPWTEEERERVALIQKTVLSFVSRNRLQRIVEKLTYYDGEGYPNLRYYLSRIERMAERQELKHKAAIHFNLKHFSIVNQQVGRRAGDLAMRNFFEQLTQVIGERGLLCRLGGDNFIALCHMDELDSVLAFLSGTPVVYDVNTGDRVMISGSAGVYVLPEGFAYDNPGDIMDKVLSVSQMARTGGQGDVIFYTDDFAANRDRLNNLQNIFPQAMEEEEFKVFYQPKIDIETGELAGAEALCRWFHDGHIVSPVEFIPMLEQSMDICKLDFYMLDHVCRDIRRWLDEGKHAVRVSVNLSRKHMVDMDLYQHIVEIIDRNRVPHEYIEIELTETTTDVEFKDLKRVVRDLQQAGISASVDDFGIGYSSLNLLKEIPWNVVKVDKSFLPLEDDDAHSTRSVMFRSVVTMAKELGLECVAEGVETREQLKVLQENHCDLAQGFYFDKPLPTSDFEQRLKQHNYRMV